MRQNKNITIAYDLSEEKDKNQIDCLEIIARDIERSTSYVAKAILKLGLQEFCKIIIKMSENETK